jgi:hypothetical protein
MEDTTEEPDVHSSLELDRIKEKLKGIWNLALQSHCSSLDITDEEKSQYLEDNQLHFAGDTEEQPNEMDSILEMLENLMNPADDLDPVDGGGTAPSYSGSSLKSNTESSKAPKGSYTSSHASTATPSDSQSKPRAGSYDRPQSNKISTRRDATVITMVTPLFDKFKDDLLDLKSRQAIGNRRRLFR